MPIHIEELTTNVEVVDGSLPFSDEQLERIAAAVLAKLKEGERAAARRRDVRQVRRTNMPTLKVAR